MAYILAAALLPLGHHHIACRFKSTIHCTSCAIGSPGELVADGTSLTRVRFTDAGWATAAARTDAESVIQRASSGRSPPALAPLLSFT